MKGTRVEDKKHCSLSLKDLSVIRRKLRGNNQCSLSVEDLSSFTKFIEVKS